ncbi:MAG: hypothetical protein IT460_07210 [Planctomycetes bacterium]|nr:hypothetical protein [Planctomycetota bacterium]
MLIVLVAVRRDGRADPTGWRVDHTRWLGREVHLATAGEFSADGAAVLVLGMGADGRTVLETSKSARNPATGRPYDVVVGCRTDPIGRLQNLPPALAVAERALQFSCRESLRIIDDHLDPHRTASAVAAAVRERFNRESIRVTSLDLHSNGNPVGLALLESQRCFEGVRRVNLMCPDYGLMGHALSRARLERLRRVLGGDIEFHLWRIQGDIVPKFGLMTRALGSEASMSIDARMRLHRVGLSSLREVLGDLQGWVSDGMVVHPPFRHDDLLRALRSFGYFGAFHSLERILEFRSGIGRAGGAAGGTLEEGASMDNRGAAVDLAGTRGVRPVVGGVDLAFDDASLLDAAGSLDDAGITELLTRSTVGVGADGDYSALSQVVNLAWQRVTTPVRGGWVAVSLRHAVAQAEEAARASGRVPASTLLAGRPSRFHGFVRTSAGDDIILLARRAPGLPPARLVDLVEIVNCVWRRGAAPWVSLDPQPGWSDGLDLPFSVRVGGVAADGATAQALLDADYSMKRYSQGVASEPKGVQSEFDFLTPGTWHGRFWFVPAPVPARSILVEASGRSVLFDAALAVDTEAMALGEKAEPLGHANPGQRAWAASFTRDLPVIERHDEHTGRLRGILDMVVLARLLRILVPEDSLLHRASSLQGETVEARVYPTLTSTRGTGTIRGGVSLTTSVWASSMLPSATSVVPADRLMTEGSPTVPAVDLPDMAVSLPLTERSGDPGSHESMLLRDAAEAWRSGRWGECEDLVERCLASSIGHPQALLLRARLRLRRGELSRARSDAHAAARACLEEESVVVPAMWLELSIGRCLGESETRRLVFMEQLLPSGGLTSEMHRILGELQHELGDDASAEASYLRAASSVSKVPARLGVLVVRLRRAESAGAGLLVAPALPEREHLTQPRDLASLAEAEVLVGNAAGAAATLDAASSAPGLDRGASLRILEVRAELAARVADWARVHDLIREASAMSASDVGALVGASIGALRSGHREHALLFCDWASAVAPHSVRVASLRARVIAQLSRVLR